MSEYPKPTITIEQGDEEWLDVRGYLHYAVSNKGRVFQQYHNRLVRPFPEKETNILRLSMSENSRSNTQYVHRLVASSFFQNFESDRNVDFIDQDKSNVVLENLKYQDECSTPPTKRGFPFVTARWIVATNIRTNETSYYHSVREAAQAIGCRHEGIYRNLYHQNQTVSGHLMFIEIHPTIIVDGVPVIRPEID